MRSSWKASLLFVALVGAARADEDAYKKAMSDGHAAQKRGDHAGAKAAFERAVSAHPEDPAALSELSWASLEAGDLARAEEAGTHAAKVSADPKQKAGALYNLGRAQEQRGEKDQAAASYRESIALRPNESVKARLAALSAAPSNPGKSAADALAPAPLEGPFASLDAWCAAEKKKPRPPKDCFLDEKKPVSGKPIGPFAAARELQSGFFDDRHLLVALQTNVAGPGAGWYVSRAADDEGSYAIPMGAIENNVPIAGAAPILLIHYLRAWAAADRPDARYSQRCTDILRVCGLGDDKRPRCTPPIPVRDGTCDETFEKTEWDWALDAEVAGRNLQIKAVSGALPERARALVGTHALGFH